MPRFKVVAGGQTGVDQAALHAAAALGIETGGFVLADGTDERGPIPLLKEWKLVPVTDDMWEMHRGFFMNLGIEFNADDPFQRRALMNAWDSSGTLTVLPQAVKDGTNLGIAAVNALKRPMLTFTMQEDSATARKMFCDWLRDHSIEVLNINGPRESSVPGIHEASKAIFEDLFNHAIHSIFGEKPES
mmetsp:Transcript_8732/g.20791  ORF Transcript_8732/g.20791 Transcript_8732/m.20791 type:complete len:188 (-) Transcript_8732:124-687(-)